MHNLLILYNPFYQADVIEEHLKVLFKHKQVAFGKVVSKINDMPALGELDEIYSSASENNYIQLFLSDLANLYVAKVVAVLDSKDEISKDIVPEYYAKKGLKVSEWFIISDIRELVRSDFECVRDEYLAGFTTPSYGGHTYATYGNRYAYPLILEQKIKKDYFTSELAYYPDIYKSKEFLNIKSQLLELCFGEGVFRYLLPDSLENIIVAEIEFRANRQNPLYDFSGIILRYSKVIEQEVAVYFRNLVLFVAKFDESVLDTHFSVQGKALVLRQAIYQQINLGSYSFLLRKMSASIMDNLEGKRAYFATKILPEFIKEFRDIRNESVHGLPARLIDAKEIRQRILGIARNSIISELLENRVD